MNFFNDIITTSKVYIWNLMNVDETNLVSNKICNKFSQKLYYDDFEKNDNKKLLIVDDKQSRINTLLFIRQVKNIYYKFTNQELFKQELYDIFIKDDNFDGGMTAFDDEDDNIRIFDKYILEYIKNRNNIMTYLQCKDKTLLLKANLEDMKDNGNVLFVIDMNEKELFQYCYEFVQQSDNVYMLKDIIFSLIIKYNDKIIRTNINSQYNGKQNHYYLIMERLLN